MGQTYRKLDDPVHARALYRQFLDEAPANHPARAQAERVLRELDEAANNAAANSAAANRAAANDAAANHAAAKPNGAIVATAIDVRARAQPRRRALRIAGITIGIAGVALLGGGVGAQVAADGNARELNRLDQTGGPYDPDKLAAYTRDRSAAGACFGVGGALAATGIVLLAVSAR
jgi:hypothetical protein